MRTRSVEPWSPSRGKAQSVELRTTPAVAPKGCRSSSYSLMMRCRPTAVTTSSAPWRLAWRIQETTVSSTSKGTLFLRRQRRRERASSARRGKVSKGRIKTRTTGSGIRSASGEPCAGTRCKTFRSTARTASGWTILVSTGEAMTAPGGSGSMACDSRWRPVADQCAAATCVEVISTTTAGCGMALSQRSRRFTGARSKNRLATVAELVKERHLIDFAEGGGAAADFGEAGIAQEGHAFFFRDALDFRSGAAIDDHFADVVGEIEQLGDGGASAIAAAGTFQAAGAFVERNLGPLGGIEAGFFEDFRGVLDLFFAIFADDANQALREDAIQRGDEIVGFDAHVDEAADDVRAVVGVHGGEDQVAGERGIDGDLRGFLVANFADHDFIGIVTQDRAQAAGKGEAFLFVDGNLGDAADLIFDGIFDGDDFVFVVFDFVDGGVEGSRFAGAGGSSDQDHAVGFLNIAAEAGFVWAVEADDIESQVTEFFAEGFFVEDAEDGVFAVDGGHDGDAEVHEAAFVAHAEAAVLRDAALGDIKLAHDFDAGEDGGVPFLGEGLHGVLQHAVNAVFDDDFGVAGFDVNVTGASLEGSEDDGVHEAHDGADAGIARELVHRDVLVAVLIFADDLEREAFGGLVQDALGLLGAFQQVVNLGSGGDFNLQAFAQQERKLVGELELAGIGHGDHQGGVMSFQWHEFVAKHQFGGDAAEEVGINALFAKIDEGAAIAFGEAARLFAFGGLVCAAGNERIVGRIVGGGGHRVLSPSAHLEGEKRQIKGDQNKAYHNGHNDQNDG